MGDECDFRLSANKSEAVKILSSENARQTAYSTYSLKPDPSISWKLKMNCERKFAAKAEKESTTAVIHFSLFIRDR